MLPFMYALCVRVGVGVGAGVRERDETAFVGGDPKRGGWVAIVYVHWDTLIHCHSLLLRTGVMFVLLSACYRTRTSHVWVCVCVCVCVCVRLCIHILSCVHFRMGTRVCVLAYERVCVCVGGPPKRLAKRSSSRI